MTIFLFYFEMVVGLYNIKKKQNNNNNRFIVIIQIYNQVCINNIDYLTYIRYETFYKNIKRINLLNSTTLKSHPIFIPYQNKIK